MIGGAATFSADGKTALYGSDTFYITPENYEYFTNQSTLKSNDTIEGNGAANDTLMFLGDGNITIGYDDSTFTDVVQVPNPTYNGTNNPIDTLNWVEGNNISTIGVKTLGGTDRVTINSDKLVAWTSGLLIIDGGIAGDPGYEGNVTIDASAFTENATLLGGAGNDTIIIGNLATGVTGSIVRGGSGNNQTNQLEIVGHSGPLDVLEGINNIIGSSNYGNQDLAVSGNAWLNVANFQKLVVVGYTVPSDSSLKGPNTNTVVLEGQIIPTMILQGGGGNITNDFTASGGSSTLIGGAGINEFSVSGGTSSLFGGAGTNDFTVTGGISTLIGGAGQNSFNMSGSGNYTAIGGTGVNIFNAAGGTATITGGLGQNSYNLTAAGTYSIVGGAGSNALLIQCAASGDEMKLTQSVTVVTVNGTINGLSTSVTVSNMSSIEVDGSAAGGNTLDARGMVMGVHLKGVGPGNTLYGGAGPDILDGGSGGSDILNAGNNNDILYVSGQNSSYVGTGENTLVYTAQPDDQNVVVYGTGLLINGQLESGTGNGLNGYANGQPFTYLIGKYIGFTGWSGVNNVQIQDSGTGTTVARGASVWDLPQYETYQVDYSSGIQVIALFTGGYVSGSGGQSYTYTYDLTWTGFSADDTASIATTNVSNATFSSSVNYFNDTSSWPVYQSGVEYTIWGTLGSGGFLGLFPSSGSVTYNVTILGYEAYLEWQNVAGYSVWSGGVTVGPGVDVSNLTAVATGANGAIVDYPQSFTTGGASPDPSAITYTLSNGTQVPSGSLFPVGTTVVTATATDGSGRTSSSNFDVTVIGQPAAQSPTGIVVTTSTSDPVYGQPVTLSATIAALAPGAADPTGTVTFMDGSTKLGTGTLGPLDGQITEVSLASFLTSNLGVGYHDITAVYGGGSSDLGSTSAEMVLYIAPDATTTTLTAVPTSTVFNQSVTFTATVAVSSPGAGTPTGKVTFMDGTTILGTGTLSTSGGVTTATFTNSTLKVGSHSISAVYSGDANDFPNNSSVLAFSVTQDPTTTAVIDAPTATVYGQSLTFTATVAVAKPGAGTPTGTITFMDGTSVIGTGNLRTSGGVTTATFTTSALAVGSHSITAVYSGDTNDLASSSAALALSVSQDATTTASVIATPTATVYGQLVKFMATVAVQSPGSGAPSGTVTFEDGSTVLGTSILLASGSVRFATFYSSVLTAGTHSIIAVYNGDANDLPSTSVGSKFIVSQDSTTASVSASPANTVFGQPETFKALISVKSPGAGSPTGVVTFMDGTTKLGTGTLSTTSGVTSATLTTNALAVGSHSITVVYPGDDEDLSSTSAALTFVVSQDSTKVVVTGSPSTSVYGQSATFTATVSVSSPGAGIPTGSVTFKDGSTVLGTGTLSTTGGVTTATFSTAKLAVGSHAITAVYSGDTDDLTSTSPGLTYKVSQDATTATLASSPSATVFGQVVTFTVTIAINTPGAGAPTGTVTFKDGSTVLGTGTLSTTGGVTTASFSTSKLAVGSHTITAVYGGDVDDLTSTTTGLTFVVSKDATSTNLSASSLTANLGQTLTFTATIAVLNPGFGLPTGTILFYDGSMEIGTGILSTTNGMTTAFFSTSLLTAGTHQIKAVYSGDQDDTGSTSAPITITIG